MVSGGRATDGPASAKDRAASGKAARADVPRSAHSEFKPGDQRNPVGLLLSQDETRVPELVPIRHGRMLASPFAFFRGAALVMAADLSTTPTSGLRTQLCGDAHLSNFGAYASPERRLVFDINDFDETLPGPFEWDVKRLATSFVVAGRDNGFGRKQCRKAALASVTSYREAIRDFARQPILAVWYAHLDVEEVVASYRASLSARQLKQRKDRFKRADSVVAKAHSHDRLQAIGKLTRPAEGRRRIVSDPPLIVPVENLAGVDTDFVFTRLRDLVLAYRETLQSDRGHLLDHFTLSDIAHKVVGVGSVGTRAWILLMESTVENDALLLQAKQAGPSVLSGFAGTSEYENQGHRVVAGQRVMQATSDIFLGWLRTITPEGTEDDYYVRQLRDWKLSADIAELSPKDLHRYAELCGWTLARAHARAGDRFAIAAYLGKSEAFDHAVADFAESYADQNELDHQALADAIASGRATASTGL
ncbi:uncharacterized protein (DUF2252 family) [Kribbella amoyensis]|uniref:Uncharacterized protein (DUF2252 family) n=1 Tax=Kribbella amoyensis TaxID=996641 RepID=A0A561BWD8_9ACTN|nr:DUF2252 domain-containing protein [Kribbella amoyensis]TWD83205.1 uncharacterized protein (DUF2252 family) [Kribbella amoyensis]